MIPHNSGHTDNGHDGRPTLLPDATATILIDGLIYTAYNQKKRLYQAGIHTEAEEHHLVIEVRADGNPKPLFPSKELPWETSHDIVKGEAPFWLYVDSGHGMPPRHFSASLHNPDDLSDQQSFGHILSFENLYGRSLDLHLTRLAEFNFPHGTCYAAQKSRQLLKEFELGQDPHTATVVREMILSSLTGIDIASTSDRVKRWIVLANEKKEFFRFPLQQGHHYEILLMNVPYSVTNHDPEKHFLQFYELFELNTGEKKFLVDPVKPSNGGVLSPPCISPNGSKIHGLGG